MDIYGLRRNYFLSLTVFIILFYSKRVKSKSERKVFSQKANSDNGILIGPIRLRRFYFNE